MARDMHKGNTVKLTANLLKISLLLTLLPASASAALIFNIDTFTTDKLTISIPTGPATLDATGSPPFSYETGSHHLFLIDANGYNNSWIVGNPSGNGSGAIGGIASWQFYSTDIFGDWDILTFEFRNALSAGDTVTSAISVTWSGSNVFDPTAVSSLLLTWGINGFDGNVFGVPQGTTPTSAVSDTGSTAALLGAGVVALAFARRRLGQE